VWANINHNYRNAVPNHGPIATMDIKRNTSHKALNVFIKKSIYYEIPENNTSRALVCFKIKLPNQKNFRKFVIENLERRKMADTIYKINVM
jgi:phosphoserine aminotransferase